MRVRTKCVIISLLMAEQSVEDSTMSVTATGVPLRRECQNCVSASWHSSRWRSNLSKSDATPKETHEETYDSIRRPRRRQSKHRNSRRAGSGVAPERLVSREDGALRPRGDSRAPYACQGLQGFLNLHG